MQAVVHIPEVVNGGKSPADSSTISSAGPVGMPALTGPFGVRLWTVCCRAVPREVLACLSPHERVRCASFRREGDRRRFAATRATLRFLLGKALGVEPSALVFGADAHGKPELAWPRDRQGIAFNVSHAGEYALIALARARSVGVDIEVINPDVDIDALAPLVLTDDERAHLRDGPASLRVLGFHTYWTAKEAFLKAVGIGIGDKLRCVSVQDSRARMLLLASSDPDLARHIAGTQMMVVDVPPGYAGALAVMP